MADLLAALLESILHASAHAVVSVVKVATGTLPVPPLPVSPEQL